MISTLGNRIQSYRKLKNLSQKQLAGLIGVERSTVSLYENDLRQPSFECLVLISEVLGVTTDELLGKRRTQTIDINGLCARDIKLVMELVERLREKYGKE